MPMATIQTGFLVEEDMMMDEIVRDA